MERRVEVEVEYPDDGYTVLCSHCKSTLGIIKVGIGPSVGGFQVVGIHWEDDEPVLQAEHLAWLCRVCFSRAGEIE